jgi:hypothetical protein
MTCVEHALVAPLSLNGVCRWIWLQKNRSKAFLNSPWCLLHIKVARVQNLGFDHVSKLISIWVSLLSSYLEFHELQFGKLIKYKVVCYGLLFLYHSLLLMFFQFYTSIFILLEIGLCCIYRCFLCPLLYMFFFVGLCGFFLFFVLC